MAASSTFRVGRVRAFLRGRIWYLSYSEQGRRRQPRAGADRAAARNQAAEINAQLEAGVPSAMGFEPIGFAELRQQWLDHHENVRRSSLGTIRRYRSATQHLLNFLHEVRPLKRASDFRPQQAEEFVRYLRTKKVPPNGHKNAATRSLRDAGVKHILEICSSMLTYAQRRRHLPPYAENPFQTIEVCRIPIEDAKPTLSLADEQQTSLLQACVDWQFPLMLTLLFTGLRPGELVHLLLPEDLNLTEGWLYVRNKPRLGWQVKTRNERDVPLVPVLADVLRIAVGDRTTGLAFRQRRCVAGYEPPLAGYNRRHLEQELVRRQCREEAAQGERTRDQRAAGAAELWRDLGVLKEDWVRIEFMRLTRKIGMSEVTAPKMLRHTFATILQDANVDPLVRNLLMGHAPMAASHGQSLGMTATYTHTRPETKRKQLQSALESLPVYQLAASWVETHRSCIASATVAE